MTSAWQAQDAPLPIHPPIAHPPADVLPLVPRLSVIVPATNAPPTLDRVLAAITPSLALHDELIVVREPALAGPAEARNVGAEIARGDVLVFIDADVEIHEDALTLIRRRFAADLVLDALFGSYDDNPDADGVVSNFRNLLHHHVHNSSAGPAETFWAGLGAIRRHVFLEIGGFGSGRYPRPSVEDIELGLRMSDADLHIELDPEIRGCHLKRWTLGGMVYTDFRHRGIQWTRLLIERRQLPAVLNLGWRHRLSSGVAVASALALLRGRVRGVAAALAAMVLLNRSFYALLARRRGVPEASLGVGLHVIHHLTAVASLPAGAAAHLRWRLTRNKDPRAVRGPHVGPVSHGVAASARRSGRGGDSALRVGLVGCGRLAERAYIDALTIAGGVRLTAVADVEPERCAAVAPGVPAFAGVSEMVASGLVDAVVIATPAHTHVAAARVAVEAGLPVLVEKPPAEDAAGASALADLGGAVSLGFNRRFEPGVERLARAVPAAGPIELSLTFAAQRGTWDAYSSRDDVLLDLGPHLVDLASFLSGASVKRVRATLDGETASLELDLGERGRAIVDVFGDRTWRETFSVRDGRGRKLSEHAASGLRARVARLTRPSAPHPLVDSLARQLEAFALAARGVHAPTLATARDGVRVMEAIAAARESAAAGEWVDMAHVRRDEPVVPA